MANFRNQQPASKMKYFQYLIVSAFLIACDAAQNSSESGARKSVDEIAACGIPSVGDEEKLDEYKVQPIKLIEEALGVLERPVDTNNEEAQAFFNQGVQLRHAFAQNEAISSFREAQKLDSTCAMCFWGEAWALGSFLNGHMREDKAPLAYAAIQKAQELISDATPELDKDLINAMAVRYIEDFEYEERRTTDSLYSEAIKTVYEKYPDNHEVAILYADALFLLEPRRGTREMDNPRLMVIHDVLEKVLAEDISNPGACHLYIHATESTNQPELGASCADYLGSSIPGASHINHMPSHTYNEMGRWGDGVRANIQASLTDKRAKKEGTAFAIYPGHNLHMLLYAASFDGQGAVAMQAARDYALMQDDNVHSALTAIRFGRFSDVLDLERPDKEISGGMWDFAQGYARLKTGEPDMAELYLKRVQSLADTTKAKFRFTDGKKILDVLASILEGEILWVNGKKELAIQAWSRGVEQEDLLPYDEPEPTPFSIRHWLGSALIETERYAEAEKVFNDELDDHPNNGWSLFGLGESLKGQGKSTEEVQAQFEEAWARADVWLDGARF